MSRQNGEGGKGIKDREDLLAYCGFYCGDCLGHTGVIVEAGKGKTLAHPARLGDVAETEIFCLLWTRLVRAGFRRLPFRDT